MPAIRHASFAPHVTPDTRLLILGSLPGARSLADRQYYAHPTNQFWRLLGAIVGQPLAAMPYDDRLAALREAKVALSPGPDFGAQGTGHARLNLACSPGTLTEALTRLGRLPRA